MTTDKDKAWRDYWEERWWMFRNIYYTQNIAPVDMDNFLRASFGALSRDDVKHMTLNRLQFEKKLGKVRPA